MTRSNPADRDADDAAAVIAIVAALTTAHPALTATPAQDGWGAPVLRNPLPAAGAGVWWRTGGPR